MFVGCDSAAVVVCSAPCALQMLSCHCQGGFPVTDPEGVQETFRCGTEGCG